MEKNNKLITRVGWTFLCYILQVERNILATNPRVTRFKIDWDDTQRTDSENVPPVNNTESESNQMKEAIPAGSSKPLASVFSTESNSNMEVNWYKVQKSHRSSLSSWQHPLNSFNRSSYLFIHDKMLSCLTFKFHYSCCIVFCFLGESIT